MNDLTRRQLLRRGGLTLLGTSLSPFTGTASAAQVAEFKVATEFPITSGLSKNLRQIEPAPAAGVPA